MDQEITTPRKVQWIGDSKERLQTFPEPVLRDIGHALYRVQIGETPPSAKPMESIESRVFELVDTYGTDTYRAVYKDLGFSDEVSEKELLKAQLGAEIFRILKERELTQVEAEKLLGIKHAEVSRLKAAKLSDYSVERLMRFLNQLNRDMEIRIIPSKNREGQQRVVAV